MFATTFQMTAGLIILLEGIDIDEIRNTRSFSKRYPEDDVVLPRCWGHLCIDNSIVKFCHAVSGLICKNKSTVSSEHATGVFSKLNLKRG